MIFVFFLGWVKWCLTLGFQVRYSNVNKVSLTIFCYLFRYGHLVRFPGMYWVLSWGCLCPYGSIIWSAINRWSDCHVLARIAIVTILYTINHPTTLHTHNEIQWPTAACWCHFAPRDVSYRQSWHLSTPSHSGLPRVTILLQDQCGRWFTV